MKNLKMKIYGGVQGVGFRYEAERQARHLHIFGFIMNEPDGAVYIEGEGEEAALNEFLTWCTRGPWPAKVERVETEWSAARGRFIGFKIG